MSGGMISYSRCLFDAALMVLALALVGVVISEVSSAGAQTRGRGAAETGGDFLCFKSAGPRAGMSVSSRSAQSIPFAARSILQVTVNSSASVDSTMLSTIASQIAESMVLWRRACPQCIVGNVSLLKINDTLYVDSYLAGYLRSADLNNISIGPPPTDLGSPTGRLEPPAPRSTTFPYDVVLSILSAHLTARVPLIQYEPIQRTDKAFNNLCSVNIAKLPTLLHDVRIGLGCPSDPVNDSDASAKLALYFINGFTSCGKNIEIIGCSADELVVELNARDYTFVAHSTNDPIYGRGSRKVDLLHVILHEFGHWIGLPHLNSPENLMASSIDQSKCINDDVVKKLRETVLDVSGRRKGKGAFYYSRSAAPSF
jgi:hypothetical protein